MSDLQRFRLNLFSIKDFVDILFVKREIKCQETARVYTSTESTVYNVHCNLKSPGTQSSAIQIKVSTLSLSGQMFKWYCYESNMHGRSHENTLTVLISTKNVFCSSNIKLQLIFWCYLQNADGAKLSL